jgi:hypothetical protein
VTRQSRTLASALLSGLVIGAVGGAMWQRHVMRGFLKNGPDTNRVLSRLTHDLDLDNSQRKAIETILDEGKVEIDKLHQDTEARFEAVRANTRESIRKLLNPDQQKKFEEVTARWDERHKKWWGIDGGHNPK